MLAMPFASAQEPLGLLSSIELPRVEGRIDHLAFDGAGQRLFVAALGNNTVEVVDLKAGKHLRSLPGFREPQGIAVSFRRGDDSNNVRYDAGARRVYVGFGRGALAETSTADAKTLAEVKLA